MTQPPNEISYQLAATPSRRRPRKPTLSSQPLGPPLVRITRLMALAIHFEGMLRREGFDYGELARLGHVSRRKGYRERPGKNDHKSFAAARASRERVRSARCARRRSGRADLEVGTSVMNLVANDALLRACGSARFGASRTF
jgi:hypothetical protein